MVGLLVGGAILSGIIVAIIEDWELLKVIYLLRKELK